VFDTLTRLPSTPAETAADVVRALGLLSFVVASLVVGGTAFPLFALILLGQFLPRYLALPSSLDITIGVVLLAAGWSNPLDLYRMIPSWDLVMHFAANGLVAVVGYVLFVRLALSGARSSDALRSGLPIVAGILLTTTFGMAAGVVWEIGEWFGHTFIDTSIVVEYTDTIGDLAAGALGSLVAGGLLALQKSRSVRRSTVAPLWRSLLSSKD
jgi:hypothetical protein